LQAVRVIAEEQGYLVRGMSVSGSAAGTLEGASNYPVFDAL